MDALNGLESFALQVLCLVGFAFIWLGLMKKFPR